MSIQAWQHESLANKTSVQGNANKKENLKHFYKCKPLYL
jgi:hypothetical protein